MPTWGSWTSDHRLRAGLSLSMTPSTVDHNTSSVTISWTLSGETYYASSESGASTTPYTVSGDISASGYGGGWNEPAGGTWTVASGSKVFNTSYTSSVKVSVNAHFTSTYAYPGDTAYVSDSITIPQRPIAPPANPTGAASTYVSDTQQNVTWTNVSPTDPAAPYQGTTVERELDDATWSQIASLGVVQSYTDYGTTANHQYRYRIRSYNSAGYSSSYSYSAFFYTTPAPPTNVAASKTSTGDIQVTWTDASPWNDIFTLWHAANGVWDASALATINNGTNSYTHVAPDPAATHTYRLTSHVTTPSLTSAYSTSSNTVQLIAAPNAPTSLSPNGAVEDSATAIALAWTHNPVDTSTQTAFEVQYQVDGGAFTSMGKVASANEYETLAANAWGANGHTIGWQVRTWGAATTGGSDGTGASPWSATASVTLSSTPTSVINTPQGPRTVTDGATTAASTTVTSATANFTSADVGAGISGGSIPAGATISSVTNATTVVISAAATATATAVSLTIDVYVTTSTLTVTWGYAQAEGSPQSQWRVTLYDATGTNVLETQSGNGTATSVVMATQLSDATTYRVGAQALSAAGLWSTQDVNTFDVSYATPPTPTVTATWIASEGAVQLTVSAPDPVAPEVAVDHLQVWRQIGLGAWVLVADNITNGSTVNDYLAALRATNTYMAVAVSTLPSTSGSTTVNVDTTPGCHHVWVNAGPGFAQKVAFTTSVDISVDEGVQKALNEFAGRTKPVETTGEQTEQVITIRAVKYDPLVASALAAETSAISDIAALAKLPAPACVRTPDGLRVFVSMGVPSFGALGTGKVRSISWTLVEVDYTEPTAS